LTDSEDRKKNKILTGTDQRMVNQKDSSQMEIEVIQVEMIKGNRDVSDAAKRVISKGIAWQKTSIYIMRKRTMKMLT